jgi:hypothetical protein
MDAKMKPSIPEYRAEQISKCTHAISAIASLIEKLRSHNNDECLLEDNDISELAKNGYILSGLINAIEIMSHSINVHVDEMRESDKTDGQ